MILIIVVLLSNTANSQIFKGKENKNKEFEKENRQYQEEIKRKNKVEGDKYSGWVFIDGKYIDAPYTVKRKGLAIYINGIQVTKEFEPEKDPFAINGKVGYPPNLNDSSSLDDLLKIINKELGISYFEANCNYFSKNYNAEDALDSIVQYYKNAPNILSVEGKYMKLVKTKKGEEIRLISIP